MHEKGWKRREISERGNAKRGKSQEYWKTTRPAQHRRSIKQEFHPEKQKTEERRWLKKRHRILPRTEGNGRPQRTLQVLSTGTRGLRTGVAPATIPSSSLVMPSRRRWAQPAAVPEVLLKHRCSLASSGVGPKCAHLTGLQVTHG